MSIASFFLASNPLVQFHKRLFVFAEITETIPGRECAGVACPLFFDMKTKELRAFTPFSAHFLLPDDVAQAMNQVGVELPNIPEIVRESLKSQAEILWQSACIAADHPAGVPLGGVFGNHLRESSRDFLTVAALESRCGKAWNPDELKKFLSVLKDPKTQAFIKIVAR